jgi:purine-binding chemotaxis protein CheW
MTAELPRQEAAPDWVAVRARLEHIASTARAALEPSPEVARVILEDRARVLARVPTAPADAAAVLTVVTFALGDEHYALETRFVRRVMRDADLSLTPIPGTPEVLVGVINLAGEILAVFDVARFLGLPRTLRTQQTRVLVLGVDRDEFGVLADAAHEVRPLRIDAILAPPGSFEGAGRSNLRGVTAEALVVLDGAALLRDPGLVVDQGEEASQGV